MEAASHSDVKRKEFHHSRLFIIGVLVIYGGTGGVGEGDILCVVFLGTG